ncbi:hypothetical protein Rwratislav_40360 [Rhodococcus wratislaviensis IFP 2016]|nr:hypothetical protein Rwratislav_40360 [Rhodococcus wratislaviensis IFP 2016]
MAKSDAKKKFGRLSHSGLMPIAESRCNPSGSGIMLGQSVSSRISVIPTVSTSHVVLVYANISNANGLGEWGGDCTVKVTAALEYKSTSGVATENGIRVPAYFGGQKVGELAPGAILMSDPIPFDAVAGTQLFVRTNMQTNGSSLGVPTGMSLQGGTGVGGVNNGEGYVSYAAIRNGTIGTSTASTSQTYPGPVAILGYVNGYVPTAGIFGDSIQAGTGDGGYGRNDGGYLVRAPTAQPGTSYSFPTTPVVPFFRLARGGESLNQFLTQASALGAVPTYSHVRNKMSSLVSTVLFAYGTNDLGGTLATLKTQYIQAANSFLRKGKYFVGCTLLPRTTSTDGWSTAANQTVTAVESDRAAFNTWLRDGTFASATVNPAGCAIFDGAAAVEVNSSGVLTLNGGRWKPASGSVVATGTLTAGSSATSLTDSSKTDVYGFKTCLTHRHQDIADRSPLPKTVARAFNSATRIRFRRCRPRVRGDPTTSRHRGA